MEELPYFEKHLITEKYLSVECEYLKEETVCKMLCDPPISKTIYQKYRNRAFYKLALLVGIEGTGVF